MCNRFFTTSFLLPLDGRRSKSAGTQRVFGLDAFVLVQHKSICALKGCPVCIFCAESVTARSNDQCKASVAIQVKLSLHFMLRFVDFIAHFGISQAASLLQNIFGFRWQCSADVTCKVQRYFLDGRVKKYLGSIFFSTLILSLSLYFLYSPFSSFLYSQCACRIIAFLCLGVLWGKLYMWSPSAPPTPSQFVFEGLRLICFALVNTRTLLRIINLIYILYIQYRKEIYIYIIIRICL